MAILEKWLYADPCDAAMRLQARKCTGCKSLKTMLGREFCAIGKRELVRCKRYEIEATTPAAN